MNDHKKYKNLGVGPGGIHCPCCDPAHKGGSKKSTKKYFNRLIRRKFKQEVKDAE